MKSVIFNTQEVIATQEGRKLSFRAVIKPQPSFVVLNADFKVGNTIPKYGHDEKIIKCPFEVGDKIFVKEKFKIRNEGIYYGDFTDFTKEYLKVSPWEPARQMKQHQSRLTLRITDISVERLQDISEEDAIAEGINFLQGSEIADTGDYFESEYYFGDLEESEYDCKFCNNEGEEIDGIKLPHCSICINNVGRYANTYDNHFEPFEELWNSTHKKPSEKWEANPFVWKISFEVVK